MCNTSSINKVVFD